MRSHPNPYSDVQLEAELRSPRFRTFLMPAFWDGGHRIILRFAPTEPGTWDFRVSSNIQRFDGLAGRIEATASRSPGFIKARNVHHWGYTETNEPHLWMGDTCYRLGFIDRAAFNQLIAVRSEQKFNHLRGLLLGRKEDTAAVFSSPDKPNPDYFREVDDRVKAMNQRGMVADLILSDGVDDFLRLFPTRAQRERYIRYVVARYAAMHVTWQLARVFENYPGSRELLKEVGLTLKKTDPYNHPRSTGTLATSGPLYSDGWMDYILYASADDQLGAIEHQLYPAPCVNAGFAREDSGAGKWGPQDVGADTFRRRLWNATMDGQYPVFANTGTTGDTRPFDPGFLNSPAAQQMRVWFEFFSGTRHWELEPYFDVDGGRAVALERLDENRVEGIEYIIYVEKPGPVEVVLPKHNYDVAWVNPTTGERFKQKDFKGDRYRGQPPDNAHDWVLHLSREGRKRAMLKSYKFDSRPILMQEIEQNAAKVPFDLVEPAAESLSVGRPVKYLARVKRESRATRSMMWLWTGEVVAEGSGYRVLGTGAEGEMVIPAGLAQHLPALLTLRLAGMNAAGKVYFLDKIFKLTP